MYGILVKLSLGISVRNQSVVPLHSTFNKTCVLRLESYQRKLIVIVMSGSLLQPSAEMFRHLDDYPAARCIPKGSYAVRRRRYLC